MKPFLRRQTAVIFSVVLSLLWSANSSGQPGTHLSLDGSNDYVSCPSLNVANQSFTIELWARRQGGFYQYQYLFSQGAEAGSQFAGLLFRTNNVPSFSFWGDDLDASSAIVDANWHHYAVTYNSVSKVQAIYIDGVLNASRTASANTIASGTAYIGGSLGATQTFWGHIEEFRFWNTARSAAEISRTMNCELQGNEAGLLRNYRLNQGTAGSTNTGQTLVGDGTIGANHGTLINFSLTGSASNWIGGSPIITGITIPSAPAAGAQGFCAATNPTVANLMPAPSSSVRWYTTASGGAALASGTALNTGTYYVVLVNANGCESSRTSVSITVSNVPPAPTVTTTINYIQGATSTALTATGSNLLWYMVSSGGTGSSTAPTPSTLNAGTTSYWVSQSSGVCESPRSQINVVVAAATASHLNFDAVNDFVSCGIKAAYDFTSGTVEAWVRPAASSSPRVIVANRTVANNTQTRWSLHLNQASGTVGLYNGSSFTQLTVGTITAGTWNHFAFVINNTSVDVYMNGAYKGAIASGMNTTSTGNPLLLGASDLTNSYPGEYWSGDMDEVRIWNTALSADNIMRRKNCELQGNEAGLVAYYKFNQGTAGGSNPSVNNLLDATANANNGSLTNFALAGSASNWLSGSSVTTGSVIPGAPLAYGQSFCGPTSVNQLVPLPGTTANWYSASTGGSALASSTPINTSGTYYVTTVNANGCESTRTPVFITINSSTSLASSYQAFSTSISGIADLPACNSLVTRLNPNGANPVNGTVNVKLWIESSQPASYVKRHYEITPSTSAGTATATITLYFTQAEFDAFNAVNTVKLPAGPGDGSGIANLQVEKRSGTTNNGTGLPASYTASVTTIDPADADIVWNASSSRWEVSFSVTGFSGFFVKTSFITLPVVWSNFSGTVGADKQAVLSWSINEHDVQTYEVEKSVNGSRFAKIGSVSSYGNGTNHYQFTDASRLEGVAYYRIKQIDDNGMTSYSGTVKLSTQASSVVSVKPNPVLDKVTIEVNNSLLHTKLVLQDLAGRVLQTIFIQNNSIKVDMSSYGTGIYLLKFETGETQKLIK